MTDGGVVALPSAHPGSPAVHCTAITYDFKTRPHPDLGREKGKK